MKASFNLTYCSACGRYQMLKGKRCYDCYISGFTRRTKDIPWRVNTKESKSDLSELEVEGNGRDF